MFLELAIMINKLTSKKVKKSQLVLSVVKLTAAYMSIILPTIPTILQKHQQHRRLRVGAKGSDAPPTFT